MNVVRLLNVLELVAVIRPMMARVMAAVLAARLLVQPQLNVMPRVIAVRLAVNIVIPLNRVAFVLIVPL